MQFDNKYYERFCRDNAFSEGSSFHKAFGYDFVYHCTGTENKNDTLFTAGYGMNSAPHIMTALQIVKMIRLQIAGYKTQIVLGDYDVLLARDYMDAKRIANGYEEFILSLGYDINQGILRKQSTETEVAANVVFLSSKLDEDDFDYVKEDLFGYYQGDVAPLSFSTKVSIVLMLSDFISPLINKNYSRVIVTSGIDESKYVVLADKLINRLSINGSIGGFFTKVVKGLNNHPKMSKSKPDSGVFLSDDENSIKEKMISSLSNDKESLQYQIALLAETSFSKQQIETAFDNNDIKMMHTIIDETIEYIIGIASKWKKSNNTEE